MKVFYEILWLQDIKTLSDKGLILELQRKCCRIRLSGAELARKLYRCPNHIADMIENCASTSGKISSQIDGVMKLRSSVVENAIRIYGDPLPKIVQNDWTGARFHH